jgi:plasmid stabilization system protein ParE
MARRVVVQPQSDLDIQAAALWYQDQQSGLGARFLDELHLVFQRIGDNPRQFPLVEGEVRRALFRHFPYGVYFLVESQTITVLAVLHLHRQPDVWKGRH